MSNDPLEGSSGLLEIDFSDRRPAAMDCAYVAIAEARGDLRGGRRDRPAIAGCGSGSAKPHAPVSGTSTSSPASSTSPEPSTLSSTTEPASSGGSTAEVGSCQAHDCTYGAVSGGVASGAPDITKVEVTNDPDVSGYLDFNVSFGNPPLGLEQRRIHRVEHG